MNKELKLARFIGKQIHFKPVGEITQSGWLINFDQLGVFISRSVGSVYVNFYPWAQIGVIELYIGRKDE